MGAFKPTQAQSQAEQKDSVIVSMNDDGQNEQQQQQRPSHVLDVDKQNPRTSWSPASQELSQQAQADGDKLREVVTEHPQQSVQSQLPGSVMEDCEQDSGAHSELSRPNVHPAPQKLTQAPAHNNELVEVLTGKQNDQPLHQPQYQQDQQQQQVKKARKPRQARAQAANSNSEAVPMKVSKGEDFVVSSVWSGNDDDELKPLLQQFQPQHQQDPQPQPKDLHKEKWLTTRNIEAGYAQIRKKRKWPLLPSEFIATLLIKNAIGNHWVTISNVGNPKGVVNLYDSAHNVQKGYISNKTIADIVAFSQCDTANVTINIMNVQCQTDTYSCGPFAIAYAGSIAEGEDPTRLDYAPGLRECFLNALEKDDLPVTLFPSSKHLGREKIVAQVTVPICYLCCGVLGGNCPLVPYKRSSDKNIFIQLYSGPSLEIPPLLPAKSGLSREVQ